MSVRSPPLKPGRFTPISSPSKKRRYTTGKNYNIGLFHTSYRCINIYLLLEADIEIQLRIASEIFKVKFDVVRNTRFYL